MPGPRNGRATGEGILHGNAASSWVGSHLRRPKGGRRRREWWVVSRLRRVNNQLEVARDDGRPSVDFYTMFLDQYLYRTARSARNKPISGDRPDVWSACRTAERAAGRLSVLYYRPANCRDRRTDKEERYKVVPRRKLLILSAYTSIGTDLSDERTDGRTDSGKDG